MSYLSFKNTYLEQLPHELQDYIANIVKKQQIIELNKEVIKNTDQCLTLTHMENETLYKKLIDYLMTCNWRDLHIYLTRWLEKVVYVNNNKHIYNFQWINNEEHDLCRFVLTIENIFLLLHDKTLHKETTSSHSIRTSIMLSVFQLTYQELFSLCKFIKTIEKR